jgi:hypothetical protein
LALDSLIIGDLNKIQDLEVSSAPSELVRLKWGYHNLGDYSQNGTVSVDDVTPIAMHYGEHYPDMWQDIDWVIDEGWHIIPPPNNGADLIGDDVNGGRDLQILYLEGIYGNTISGYAVYGATDWNGPYTESNPQQVISFSQIQGDDRDSNGILDGRGWFDAQVNGFGKRYIKIVPIDGAGNRYESLGVSYHDMQPSVDINTLTPRSGAPGDSVTFNCEPIIQPPGTTYAWDFGGGATPNTANVKSGTITLGALGTYSASVTVNNGFASFTLNWQLEVTNAPRIYSVTPLKMNTGTPYEFNVNWTGSRDNVSFLWDFDSWATPNSSTDESPTVTPGAPVRNQLVTITITNAYGQQTRSFYVDIGRAPHITSVSPLNAVIGFSQTYEAELEYTDCGPYDYEWTFDSYAAPVQHGNPRYSYTFLTPGEHQCSVRVSNVFGWDYEPFTVYVRANRLWLVAYPAAFTWQYFEKVGEIEGGWRYNDVNVRVIAVDNGYALRYLSSGLVQYDGFASTVGGIDSGAPGGGAYPGDGIWQAYNAHFLTAMVWGTIPESPITYTIPGEPPSPISPPPDSKAFWCNIGPHLEPDDLFELPAGSGLSLAEYADRDASSPAGDLFNFTLSINEHVPGPSNPTEIRVRLVNRILRGTSETFSTCYTDTADNIREPYQWNVVQLDGSWVPVPDRYYLTIPIINN